jgi:GntR family transcriptional regulator, transcriptional repressor for pyruvate dehydrogenase complex
MMSPEPTDKPVPAKRRPLAERRTLSQAITTAVLDRIRDGEFRPGDRLPTEKGLMEEYGVGRNSAREAVQALAAMGLVDVRPGRGATVISVDGEKAMDRQMMSVLLQDQALQDLYAFRRLLEVETARCAALYRTPEDLVSIEGALAGFRRAVQRGRLVSELDDELHSTIAQASQNSVYATVLDAVSGLIANARRYAFKVPWASARAIEEHDEIVRAIRERDPDAAVAVMNRHLDGALEAIREGRDEDDERPPRR